ncbi:hypothetical protein PR202_ga11294 [Eleusine coracana subsp. coracana]|uniref:RING-type E3 ubiquitin transferase n=1 Tax=Eleusine coracana subsp. coracana TaxID=191504 RepID=A0AAV5C923_ELECO|nr:hypothetical protein PR202_ga11294 [Eleusine coracana subsp. coracana]
MPPPKHQHLKMKTMMVEDTGAFDCDICCHPLKPPIFQCNEGHALCSSCSDKLATTGKCHVCGTSTRGGYRRCRAMEHLVETAHVECLNAAHGCDAKPVYYDLASHRQVCPHAPCHCPGKGCSFVGSTKKLLDHVSRLHGWPCTIKIMMPHEVCLGDGFNFLVLDRLVVNGSGTVISTTGHFLFLLNVARQPLGRAISVFCIHPHHKKWRSSKAVKCVLTYSQSVPECKLLVRHHLQSDLCVDCTDLSNGLPHTEKRFMFVVPNSALGDKDEEAINVTVDISICNI